VDLISRIHAPLHLSLQLQLDEGSQWNETSCEVKYLETPAKNNGSHLVLAVRIFEPRLTLAPKTFLLF
jgi:hypothetical protein